MPFLDNKGKYYEKLACTICPIGEHIKLDKWQLSGTGFYINPEGLALSASHNFRQRNSDISDFKNINTPAFFRIIEESGDSVRIEITQIQEVITIKDLDIAIVLSGIKNNVSNIKLNLTSQVPSIGEKIFCYSFPNEKGNTDNLKGKIVLNDNEFEGIVTAHFLNGRDKLLLPGPCIEAKMQAIGGTSGGPVFNSKGYVFGVISTSLDGDPPITYITPIYPILDLKFKVNTNQGTKKLTMRDLAKMSIISLVE